MRLPSSIRSMFKKSGSVGGSSTSQAKRDAAMRNLFKARNSLRDAREKDAMRVAVSRASTKRAVKASKDAITARAIHP